MAGLYFEEFSVGQSVKTAGRTIGEDAIFSFAGLSGDYNQIHTDAVFANKTQFGQRVAHGLLGMSIAVGLIMQTGLLE
ncbi:MAG: MaoC/PaaZ C-terminal domain-containing protein, partial [Anaerolineales bacterium]|nr:MaoC/PaaZ C-terminal domain-containing protein [Anaerolineales bacterium]